MALHITKHSGKMKGFSSLSTSTTENPFCQSMRSCDGTVCSKCYAAKYESFRSALLNNLRENDRILSVPLEDKDIFQTNDKYFRFNSFGELINSTHLENLCKIARKNPGTQFALYTKRLDLIKELNNKPVNLILIASSPKLNEPAVLPEAVKVDHVFTVYNKNLDVPINCAQSCMECLKCYKTSDEYYIAERVK